MSKISFFILPIKPAPHTVAQSQLMKAASFHLLRIRILGEILDTSQSTYNQYYLLVQSEVM